MAAVKRKDISVALNICERNEIISSNMSPSYAEIHVGIFQLQQDTEKAAGQAIHFV